MPDKTDAESNTNKGNAMPALGVLSSGRNTRYDAGGNPSNLLSSCQTPWEDNQKFVNTVKREAELSPHGCDAGVGDVSAVPNGR